jgi:hypothetical protein
MVMSVGEYDGKKVNIYYSKVAFKSPHLLFVYA